MSELLTALLSLLVSYLLGSIPSARLFAALRGKDIFSTGSGNMGTMNALRNVGPLLGILTFALDVLKGAAAMLLAPVIAATVAPDSALATDLALAAAPFGAGLGHVFSVFAGFRGGKALAVAFGVLLPGYWPVAVGGLLLIGVLVLLTRNVNLASFVTVAAAGLTVLLLELTGQDGSLLRAAGMILLVLLICWKHLPITASARNPRPAAR